MGMIKPGYILTQGYSASMPNYTTSCISIPNDGDNSACLSKQGFSLIICTS